MRRVGKQISEGRTTQAERTAAEQAGSIPKEQGGQRMRWASQDRGGWKQRASGPLDHVGSDGLQERLQFLKLRVSLHACNLSTWQAEGF